MSEHWSTNLERSPVCHRANRYTVAPIGPSKFDCPQGLEVCEYLTILTVSQTVMWDLAHSLHSNSSQTSSACS